MDRRQVLKASRRAAGRLRPARFGAGRLADAQRHHDRSLPARRAGGSCGAAGRGGAGEDLRARRHRREPRRRRRRRRQRRRGARRARRLHAADDAVLARGAARGRPAVRAQARLRGGAARAGGARARRPDAARDPGRRAVEDAQGLRRGREEAPGRDPLRLVGSLRHAARVDGDVRRRGRHQAAACPLSRRRPCRDGAPRRPDQGACLGARRAQAPGRRGQAARARELGRRARAELPRSARPSRSSATRTSSSTSGPACSRRRACRSRS